MKARMELQVHVGNTNYHSVTLYLDSKYPIIPENYSFVPIEMMPRSGKPFKMLRLQGTV